MKIPSISHISLVTWKLNNRGINSEQALDEVTQMYDNYLEKRDTVEELPFESRIVEESNSNNEYHVIVDINHAPDTKVC